MNQKYDCIIGPSVRLDIKPLTVNRAWKGQRFKTQEYKSFERSCLFLLPKISIPEEGPICIVYRFGFSNPAQDVDGPVKMVTDILQKKFGFNDNRVYRMVLEKEVVPKGKEFIEIKITEI